MRFINLVGNFAWLLTPQSRGKYSTWLRLVLYLPLDTPPRAIFSVHTRSGALTIPYETHWHDQVDIKKLEMVQRHAARFVLNKPWT